MNGELFSPWKRIARVMVENVWKDFAKDKETD